MLLVEGRRITDCVKQTLETDQTRKRHRCKLVSVSAKKIYYLTTKQYKNNKKKTDAQSSENKCTAKNRENLLVSDLWHLEEIDLSCFKTILVLPILLLVDVSFYSYLCVLPGYINNKL